MNWWDERVHPEERERVSAGIRSAISRGEATWSDEYRFRCADGSYRWHLARALPLRDVDGRVVQWFGTWTDIEDRPKNLPRAAPVSRRSVAC